ncbi:MAG TPA: asparagine synthase (glutamine-hydrolyzing) [Firmicutes bacterium]|nr:asparagine synthase (glutamine-hydrolyzing) [Bacillota bacterium]
MCGIFGLLNRNREKIDRSILHNMGDSIIHRGPDDSGYFIRNNLGIGMRRLSIIDLQTGHQPILNEAGDCLIVLNGEIYNYEYIREHILKKEHHFKTRTDVESVLHLYEEKGTDFVHDLNGMFGLAIADFDSKNVYIYRDRMGIKPIYYYEDHDWFIWASEPKAIIASGLDLDLEIDYESIYFFLTMEYFPGEKTPYKKIKKLAPGHYLDLDLVVCDFKVEEYWDSSFPSEKRGISFNAACEEFMWLLQDSVKLRMISDVPFGCFLSGGIDSSVIAALMRRIHNTKIKTFSLGFGTEKEMDRFDELEFSNKVSEHIESDHRSWIISGDEVRESLDKILWHFDEPFGGGFHTYFVSKMSKEKVTVALSGLGADEILTGYEKHLKMRFLRYLMFFPEFTYRLPVKMLHALTRNKKIEKLSEILTKNPYSRYVGWMRVFREDLISKVMTGEFRRRTGISITEYFSMTWDVSGMDQDDSISYLEQRTTMVDDFLNYTDKTSMAHSLEVRVPFLDHRLVEFMNSLPLSFKTRHREAKYILKHGAEDLIPTEIIYRKKHPFFLPMKVWIKKEFKELITSTFNDAASTPDSILNGDVLLKLLELHNSGSADYSWEIWLSFITLRWFSQLKKTRNNQ